VAWVLCASQRDSLTAKDFGKSFISPGQIFPIGFRVKICFTKWHFAKPSATHTRGGVLSIWARLLLHLITPPMSNPFFDHPILNSPYTCPQRHRELDDDGQPTQQILGTRRRAEFITPIPKPKKRKKAVQQAEMVFDEGKDLSTAAQQYDMTSIINQVRQAVDTWRSLPNPSQWQVTPETARLLQHWRHHNKCFRFRPTSRPRWMPTLTN
jgi:hypothetical protein